MQSESNEVTDLRRSGRLEERGSRVRRTACFVQPFDLRAIGRCAWLQVLLTCIFHPLSIQKGGFFDFLLRHDEDQWSRAPFAEDGDREHYSPSRSTELLAFSQGLMSVKISELIRNPALRGLRASLYVDISDTIDVMPSGFTYTCGDFSPWFISFPVMVIKKFHFFWENDHHHPFYEYFFGSDYIWCIPQYLRFTYTCGVFVPHGSSPFSDGFNREMESSLPFYRSFP